MEGSWERSLGRVPRKTPRRSPHSIMSGCIAFGKMASSKQRLGDVVENEKPAFSNSSGLKSVIEKLRFVTYWLGALNEINERMTTANLRTTPTKEIDLYFTFGFRNCLDLLVRPSVSEPETTRWQREINMLGRWCHWLNQFARAWYGDHLAIRFASFLVSTRKSQKTNLKADILHFIG